MAAATFESLLDKEFAEVQKTREDLLAKRAEIEEQLHAIDQRFTNLKNAQAALQGKWTPPTGAPRTRKPRTESGPRAPRGSREQLKSQIIALLKEHPQGLISSQIADELPDGAKQIPNVLSILKNDGKIKQDARRGPYYLPSEAA